MIVRIRLRTAAIHRAALATATLIALAGGASAQDKPAAPGPIVKTLLQATTTADGKAFAYPDGKPLVTARQIGRAHV